ncbi:MAG: 2-dehydropantoate 2-reductase [Oceanococcus sp.]
MSSIAIFGAGSIGCYVGARLAASGCQVHFIGRPRIAQAVAQHGLSASDHHGKRWQAEKAKISFSEQADQLLATADCVLVCVKSAATSEAAQALAPWLKANTLVISLQNGLHNAAELQHQLPQHKVLAGMVPFNVVNQGKGHFHQGSEGELEVQQDACLDDVSAVFQHADLPLIQHTDMQSVLWAKLILNLNNSINALSGQPLKTELSQRSFRRCLALAQHEALDLMQHAEIKPAKIIAIPTAWIPYALNVPDLVFRILGGKMLAIDPQARSSMWEDLQTGRKTEIDWLNGEILRLAESLQLSAPVNQKLYDLIRIAEVGGKRDWAGDELLKHLHA